MTTNREQLTVSGDRASIRSQVIMRFITEKPGTGKGDNSSKYIYEVETTKDGYTVILKRPARFNKGVDFTVHVEGIRFRQKGTVDMPNHSDIINDLSRKKENNPLEYEKVKTVILKFYNCQSVKKKEIENIKFFVGYPIEAILKSIKWLFIEQDVTYWNWSGRSMLFSALHDKGLC
jgi:hypothetical protein